MCLQKEESEEGSLGRERSLACSVSGSRETAGRALGVTRPCRANAGCRMAAVRPVGNISVKHSRLGRPPSPGHHSSTLLLSGAGKQLQTAVNKGLRPCPTPTGWGLLPLLEGFSSCSFHLSLALLPAVAVSGTEHTIPI